MLLSVIIAGLIMGAIYGMVGLGYSIIFRASGIMNLAQGEMITLSAFLGVTFYEVLGLPYPIALALTLIIMFGYGALIQMGVISQFSKRGVSGVYMILITLGLSRIMNGGCELIWGSSPRGFPSIFSVTTINIFGAFVTPERLMCFFLSAAGMLVIHLFLTRTKTGIGTRASAMDSTAAEACGIDVVKSNAIVWGIACTVAAMSGMMLGPIYSVSLTLGANMSVKGMASSVSGGFGNIYGAMVGGLLLGLVESLVGGYVDATMRDMIAYLMLFLILCVRPAGLFNEQSVRDV